MRSVYLDVTMARDNKTMLFFCKFYLSLRVVAPMRQCRQNDVIGLGALLFAAALVNAGNRKYPKRAFWICSLRQLVVVLRCYPVRVHSFAPFNAAPALQIGIPDPSF